MIEDITNTNLKQLLSGNKLSRELLMEIKTSVFIHPSIKSSEDGFYFNYSKYKNDNVLHLFTSYDEFLKCYSNDSEFEPVFWYLDSFEDAFFEDTLGVIINPGSDMFFIPASVVSHIILDIKENNFELENNLFEPEMLRNDMLHGYLSGKNTLKQYARLFFYLNYAEVYALIKSPRYLGADEIKIDENMVLYKTDSYYVLFSDKNLIQQDIKDSDDYFYYLIADVVEFVKLTLEFDFKGIILKTPVGEFTLPRKSLLNQYERIIMKYTKRKNPHELAYALGDL